MSGRDVLVRMKAGGIFRVGHAVDDEGEPLVALELPSVATMLLTVPQTQSLIQALMLGVEDALAAAVGFCPVERIV